MTVETACRSASGIGLLPDCRQASGGPASFQRKFAAGLSKRGLHPYYDGQSTALGAILLINATRHLPHIWQAKRRGVPVVQRLGAPYSSNTHVHVGPWRRARSWLGMRNVAFVRSFVADRIVYQSHFVQECWDRLYGPVPKPTRVIYNGVDLSHFSVEGPAYESDADVCIVSVEGTQGPPHDHPAVLLSQALIARGIETELLVFGKPLNDTAGEWAAYPFAEFRGLVPNADLPFYYRGATLYVLTDIVNAGCPNSVIEALACGTPISGYSLGVLPEVLDPQAGLCVPAKGDPWKGEHPGNIDALLEAALEIVANNAAFRAGARRLAETRYDLDRMVEEYVEFLIC